MTSCSRPQCKRPSNGSPLYCRCGAHFCSETCFVSAWHAGHRASCPQKEAIQADLECKQTEGGKNKVRQLCSVALSKVAPVSLDETVPTAIHELSTHSFGPAATPSMPLSVLGPTASPSADSMPPVRAAPSAVSTPPVPAAPTSSSCSKSATKIYKLEDFEEVPGGRLGQGGFGTVHKVKHKTTGEGYAMKVVPKQMVEQHNMSEYLFREVKAQLQLQHPKILRLFYYFEDAENVHLLLEYASGGSLFHHLQKRGKLPEPEAGPSFAGIVSALGFIHEKGYIHRDLKPENILICDGGTAKLADFGWCAELIKGAQRQTFCGTVAYLSPEMILNEPHGHEVDIWAVGILLFELLVGRTPWNSQLHHLQTLRKQAQGELTIPDALSLEARNLISRLLKVKPDERLPLKEVLQHSWVRRNAPQDAIASPEAVSLRNSRLEETIPTTGPGFTAPGERNAPCAAPAAAAGVPNPQTPALAATQTELASSAGRQLVNEALGMGNFSFGGAGPSQDAKVHLIDEFPLLLGTNAHPVQQQHVTPQTERKNEANLIESFPLLLGTGASAASAAPSFGAPFDHKRQSPQLQPPPTTASPQLGFRAPPPEISPVVTRVPGAAKPEISPVVTRVPGAAKPDISPVLTRVPGAAKPRAVVPEVSPIQTGRAPGAPLASQHAGFRYTKPGDTISPVVINKVPPPSSNPLASAIQPIAQRKPTAAAAAAVDTVSPILQRRPPSSGTPLPQPPATTSREAADNGPCIGSLTGSITSRRSAELRKLVSLEDLDDEPDDKNAVGKQAFPSFGLQAKGKGSRALGF